MNIMKIEIGKHYIFEFIHDGVKTRLKNAGLIELYYYTNSYEGVYSLQSNPKYHKKYNFVSSVVSDIVYNSGIYNLVLDDRTIKFWNENTITKSL